jgi:type I restriction enzyme M protein
MEHQVEAVITLPKTMYQPDATVQASILILRKHGDATGKPPRTGSVWFYQVEADGYAGGSRREPVAGPNDFWDALHKWPSRTVESTDYFQPEIWEERWRTIDRRALKAFHLIPQPGTSFPVDYLFPEVGRARLPDLEERVRAAQTTTLKALYLDVLRSAASEARTAGGKVNPHAVEDYLRRAGQDLSVKLMRMREIFLENEPKAFATAALERTVEAVERMVLAQIPELASEPLSKKFTPGSVEPRIEQIVREFARLDGFNVRMRSPEVQQTATPLPASKSWSIPFRRFAVVPEWVSSDGRLHGSHDAQGNPRPEFVADPRIYEPEGAVRAEYLHPDCIEASGYVLSAARYRPEPSNAGGRLPVAELIQRLRAEEVQLLADLDALLVMVREGA